MAKNLPQKSQFIIYQTESGETRIDVRFEDETVWLSQQLMAELFQTTVPNINLHIRNILKDGELDEEATIKDFLIVQIQINRARHRLLELISLSDKLPQTVSLLHGRKVNFAPKLPGSVHNMLNHNALQ